MASSSPVVNVASPPRATNAKDKPKRPPAPTLFVGPPSASRNASQLSVIRPAIGAETSSKDRQTNETYPPSSSHRSNDNPATSTKAQTSSSRKPPSIFNPSGEKALEARWRTMQSTLSTVERSATTAHTHVFSNDHAQALDDLREAQILLARAWGRGSEDQRHQQPQRPHSSSNSSENNDHSREATPTTAGGTGLQPRQRDDISAGTTLHRTSQTLPRHADNIPDSYPPTADGTHTSGATNLENSTDHHPSATAAASAPPLSGASAQSLEDATARDIQRANERRAANEEYFKKVAAGVQEVVGRLEGVAEAMRRVEGRSRGLWEEGGSDSEGTEMGEGREGGGEGGVR